MSSLSHLIRVVCSLLAVPCMVLAVLGLLPVMALMRLGNMAGGDAGGAPLGLFFRSNCAFFAGSRFLARGGYMLIRWTRFARFRWLRFPHLLWAPEIGALPVEHFIPLSPRPRWLPPPLFLGRIAHVDQPQPTSP